MAYRIQKWQRGRAHASCGREERRGEKRRGNEGNCPHYVEILGTPVLPVFLTIIAYEYDPSLICANYFHLETFWRVIKAQLGLQIEDKNSKYGIPTNSFEVPSVRCI